MYKVKKPMQLKIEGAFRKFGRGDTIAKELVNDKMAKALLLSGSIENFINEKAVFHNTKPADNSERVFPEEYKELRNVKDLKIIKMPPIVVEPSNEEVLKVHEKTEKKPDVKKEKKVIPIIVEETYKEEAKVADIVSNSKETRKIEKTVKAESTQAEDKVEGPLDAAISDEIKGKNEGNAPKRVVNRNKAAKRRVKTKKKVG